MKKILVAEDESFIGQYLGKLLEQNGYTILGYHATGESLLQAYVRNGADLIIADIHLAGEMNGITAVAEIRKRTEQVPVLFITADSTQHPALVSPSRLLVKPFDDAAFIKAVRQLLPA